MSLFVICWSKIWWICNECWKCVLVNMWWYWEFWWKNEKKNKHWCWWSSRNPFLSASCEILPNAVYSIKFITRTYTIWLCVCVSQINRIFINVWWKSKNTNRNVKRMKRKSNFKPHTNSHKFKQLMKVNTKPIDSKVNERNAFNKI